MDADAAKPLVAFGFLTVLEDAEHGFFGGYLVLTDRGRPLEFHCSTPVFPSQAQRILYGTTLRPYVLGELIGQTLVDKAQLPVQAVLTDLEEMLELALLRPEAVVYLASGDGTSNAPAAEATEPWEGAELTLGGCQLRGMSTCGWRPEQLQEMLAPLAAHVDLAEPFERIREAIREAQRITEPPANDQHESSAAA